MLPDDVLLAPPKVQAVPGYGYTAWTTVTPRPLPITVWLNRCLCHPLLQELGFAAYAKKACDKLPSIPIHPYKLEKHMAQFARGISTALIDRLNTEYRAGGWWKAIAEDRDLFIAIRQNYINVYLNGNSLLKLRLEGDELVGETHYKYLLVPETSRPYVRIIGGQARIESHADLFLHDLTDLQALKRAANTYSGEEKRGVHQIVMCNPNVIDVEIAFGAENEKTGSITANRIDFAALRRHASGLEVVFYEAKQFINKELRAAGEAVPVFEQLQRYESFLRNEQQALIDSYRTVCGNLIALDGVRDRYAPMQDMMNDLSDVAIQGEVRLVVFGFDNDQKNGTNWLKHWKKLDKQLGCNLLLKGDTKDFTNGIASPL